MKIRMPFVNLPLFKKFDTCFKLQKLLLIFFGVYLSVNSCKLVSRDQGNFQSVSNPIAYAWPVAGIKIDGEISDWPDNMAHFDIQYQDGNELKDKEDLIAYFQTAYNLAEQALYFAIVISDDSHVVDSSEQAKWDAQDKYFFFLDSRHLPSGSGVVKYEFNEKEKKIYNPADSWDPEIKNANWDNIQVASKHVGQKIIYELRIVLKDQIIEGKSIGIDHYIVDKDSGDETDKKSYILWGEGQGKDNSPLRLGNVILMRQDESTGSLSGQLEWKDSAIKNLPGKVRITSKQNPSLWVLASVDSTGKYSAALPPGNYEITPVLGIHSVGDSLYRIDRTKSHADASISANETVTAPTLELSAMAHPDLIPEKGILHSFDKEKAILLDEFTNAYRDYYEIPGVSLALIKNGKVIYHKTYGVKNTYTNEPVDENTLFEAASITKPVFAFAVLRLAEKGIIDLDKPLYQYLPFEEIAHDDRYKLITARLVLCHQTGFPNWAYMNKDNKLDIKFMPGTSFGYSGEGYEYLKRVVAHITNKTIDAVLQEEVLNPLGLENTYFSKNDYLAKVVSNGHFNNLPTRAELPENAGMAGGMHTEASSFTDFVLALLNRKGLKPETYDEMFKIQTIVPPDEDTWEGFENYFGLGIALQKTPFGWVFGHGGNNGDFQCQFMMFKDLDMGYVIFTNSNTGGMLAYDPIMEFLITGKEK